MKVDLSPAQLERRVLAGLFDGVVLLALCAAYFLIPAVTLGVVLPMWGVLAAIVGYSVVPLAVFKQTLGMRLFSIELVGREGHPVALGDVLFRELLGRGWFPAAFLFNLLFSYVAMKLGLARFTMPTGMQLMFSMASLAALFVAVFGHALILAMRDRRGVADLMARSWVVPQQARALPSDADELAELRAARARSIRNVAIAEVVIVVVGLALPWVFTFKPESTEVRAARLLRQKLEVQFKQNPTSEAVSRELQEALWAEGKRDEARAVRALHEAKVEEEKQARLADNLRELDASPGSEQLMLEVLRELEQRGRLEEAQQRYARFLREHPEPEYRAGHASWLTQVGRVEEGVVEYRQLASDAPDFEGIHKFLARALVLADRLEEAQLEYAKELLLDPEDEDARDALEELDAQLGALPKAKLQTLRKELQPVLAKQAAAAR